LENTAPAENIGFQAFKNVGQIANSSAASGI